MLYKVKIPISLSANFLSVQEWWVCTAILTVYIACGAESGSFLLVHRTIHQPHVWLLNLKDAANNSTNLNYILFTIGGLGNLVAIRFVANEMSNKFKSLTRYQYIIATTIPRQPTLLLCSSTDCGWWGLQLLLLRGHRLPYPCVYFAGSAGLGCLGGCKCSLPPSTDDLAPLQTLWD